MDDTQSQYDGSEDDRDDINDHAYNAPAKDQDAPLAPIFAGLLEPNNAPKLDPAVIGALRGFFEMKDHEKLLEELTKAYPEPDGLGFLNPEPLGDVDAHLKASKLFLSLKADGFLSKISDNYALVARPLAETLSYVGANADSLNPKTIAEFLADMTKALMAGARQTEIARVELVCAGFKVPVSTANTDRGKSLMGQAFAKNVERLRKDKKVLVGDDPPQGSNGSRYTRPNSRGSDRSNNRKSAWLQRRHGASSSWTGNSRNQSSSGTTTTGNRSSNTRSSPGPTGSKS